MTIDDNFLKTTFEKKRFVVISLKEEDPRVALLDQATKEGIVSSDTDVAAGNTFYALGIKQQKRLFP